jgi:hypothetical protein
VGLYLFGFFACSCELEVVLLPVIPFTHDCGWACIYFSLVMLTFRALICLYLVIWLLMYYVFKFFVNRKYVTVWSGSVMRFIFVFKNTRIFFHDVLCFNCWTTDSLSLCGRAVAGDLSSCYYLVCCIYCDVLFFVLLIF